MRSPICSALIASAIVGEVDPARLAAGLPNSAGPVGSTLLRLRAERLGDFRSLSAEAFCRKYDPQ